MTPRRLCLFLLAVCIGLASGCATLRRSSDDLTVSLVNLQPLDGTAFESRLALTVRVTNTRPDPVRFAGARHRLIVNGRSLGIAVTPESLEVPGLSTTTQEAAFTVGHIALLPLLNELRTAPVARYEIESTFFGSGLSRDLAVRRGGQLDLSNLARAVAP